jgi:hypothetical protein
MDNDLKKLGINKTFKPAISQSCVSCFCHCERRFMFTYLWGLHPKHPPLSIAMSTGSRVHELLSVGPDRISEIEEKNKVAENELVRQIDSGEDLFGENAKRIEALDDIWNKALAIANILWEKYPANPDHTIIGSEQLIQAPYGDIPLQGTLDKIISNKKDGTYYIRDYKCSSRPTEFVMTGMKWNIQSWMYKLLFELTHFVPCTGFIWDVIQVPSIKMSGADRDFTMTEIVSGKNKGEMKKEYIGEPQLKNYITRCKEWYSVNGDQSCRSFCERFPNSYYLSVPLDISSTLTRVYDAVLNREPHPNYWPRDVSGHSCKGFNRVCELYGLCNLDTAAWPIQIEKDFTLKNPDLKKDEPADPDE